LSYVSPFRGEKGKQAVSGFGVLERGKVHRDHHPVREVDRQYAVLLPDFMTNVFDHERGTYEERGTVLA
jgi:hypothetical protein